MFYSYRSHNRPVVILNNIEDLLFILHSLLHILLLMKSFIHSNVKFVLLFTVVSSASYV